MKGTGRFTRWCLDSVAPMGNHLTGMAYACECLQQHDAAARQNRGVSIVGLALSLSFLAAIVALAFVACAGL